MNTNEAKELLEKYNKGQATEAEAQLLQYWLIHKATTDMPEVDESYYAGMSASMRPSVLLSTQPRKLKIWPRIALTTTRRRFVTSLITAAAVAIMVLGVWFFNYHDDPSTQSGKAVAVNDIAPGKQGATLTLASGRKIRLTDASNGELAEEAEVEISKSANGQLVYKIKGDNAESKKINTLSTAKGETYVVILPDNSKVWLNAVSSLTYATSLKENGQRRVKLEGEAYFEVAKDKAHPFIVESRGQQIEVLGTHFNVNSYADEKVIATTLLEGSVRVASGSLEQFLSPGHQALNNGKSIQIAKVNVEQVVDWKDGDFNLDHIDFKSAMRKIARWYNVDVVYDASITNDIETGGWVPRSNNLSEVLKALEGTGIAKFKVTGRTIYVSKN